MRRIILVLALTAVFVLMFAVPAFGKATVLPTECFTFSDPEGTYTSTTCQGAVLTPSGTFHSHFTDVTEFDGQRTRSSGTFHSRPAR